MAKRKIGNGSARTGRGAMRNTTPAILRKATMASAAKRAGTYRFKAYSDSIPF